MKLKQNIPDWDKDAVWNRVEDRLHRKKKRRLLYWWFFGAASATVLIGFLIRFNNVERTTTSWSENSIANSKQKTNLEEIQSNYPLESPIMVDNKSLEQQSASNSTPIKHNLGDEPQLPKRNIQSTVAAVQSEALVSLVTNAKSKRNVPTVSIPQDVLGEKIGATLDTREKAKILDVLPSLALSTIELNNEDSRWIKKINASLSQNDRKKISTYWWVENGLSFGKKSFTNLNGQSIGRDTTEQFRFIHTSAIGIQKALNKNWSLKLGLAYQTIYEKYKHANSSTNEEEIFSEEGIVYNLPNGITYFGPGLATLSSTKNRLIIHNNFIHRLSVPIELVYAFRNTHWSLEPSLGFRVQFFQQFNGVIAKDGAHFFDLGTINDTYYSNDLRVGLMTSLHLKYQIVSKGALGLRVTYEKDDFLNLIKNDLSSRYETIGLQLGYYHSF